MITKAQKKIRTDKRVTSCSRLQQPRSASWRLALETVVFPLTMIALILTVALVRESQAQVTLNDSKIQLAIAKLYYLIEGPFGALVMVVAGIIAIISAVTGAYRSGINLIYVGAGAFILRSLVSLFFGAYGAGGGGFGINVGFPGGNLSIGSGGLAGSFGPSGFGSFNSGFSGGNGSDSALAIANSPEYQAALQDARNGNPTTLQAFDNPQGLIDTGEQPGSGRREDGFPVSQEAQDRYAQAEAEAAANAPVVALQNDTGRREDTTFVTTSPSDTLDTDDEFTN